MFARFGLWALKHFVKWIIGSSCHCGEKKNEKPIIKTRGYVVQSIMGYHSGNQTYGHIFCIDIRSFAVFFHICAYVQFMLSIHTILCWNMDFYVVMYNYESTTSHVLASINSQIWSIVVYCKHDLPFGTKTRIFEHYKVNTMSCVIRPTAIAMLIVEDKVILVLLYQVCEVLLYRYNRKLRCILMFSQINSACNGLYIKWKSNSRKEK